jgi:membrane protease YdiL (CAAX protease family)
MSVAESGPSAALTKFETPPAQAESLGHFIVAAIGWWLLAAVGVPIVIELFSVFVTKTTIGFDQSKWPVTAQILYIDIVILGACWVFLAFARIRGRKIGHREIGVGIGDGSIANFTIIVFFALAITAYAYVVSVYLGPSRSGLVSVVLSANAWLNAFTFFLVVVLAPLADELFFRGWLWTGLQRHWKTLSIATLTSTLWVAGHFGPGIWRPVLLIPVAIVLALARYFARSVRAPIALHIIYNFVVVISPLVALSPDAQQAIYTYELSGPDKGARVRRRDCQLQRSNSARFSIG